MIQIILKKTLLPYLAMNKLYLFLLFLPFLGCKETTSTYEQINQFLKTENNIELKSFDHLVVINEMGGCLTCSARFSELMTEHIKNKSILFLICSSGIKIDISAYINQEADNIVYDFRNKFASLNIINHGSIISLVGEKIDTIIAIDASNLDENMANFKKTIEG